MIRGKSIANRLPRVLLLVETRPFCPCKNIAFMIASREGDACPQSFDSFAVSFRRNSVRRDMAQAGNKANAFYALIKSQYLASWTHVRPDTWIKKKTPYIADRKVAFQPAN